MIEVNEHGDHGVLALKISGTLTEEELDDLVPSLKEYIAESEDPHLLMTMENFEGWADAAALWKDLQLDAEYMGYFDRIAVVGEKKWQEWGTRLLDPITKEELQFFPIGQTEQAWQWVEENH